MGSALSREVADPRVCGVNAARLKILLDRVRADVDAGVLPSAQVALAKDGRVVAFETFGEATPATRYITQSAGRPLLGICFWKAMSDGLLDVDQTVASVLAPFGENGKEAVTFRHVLTHTGGFPMAPIRLAAMTDREQRLAAMARWRLDWEPGSRLEYHLTSAAWVIADAIEAVTGKPLKDYLRTEISEPLGLDLELGVPIEKQRATLAPMVPIGRVPEDWVPDPWGPWYFRDPFALAAGEPSHTICSTAIDTVLLFQSLYHADFVRQDVLSLAVSKVVEMEMSGGYGSGLAGKGLFVNIEGPATASPLTWGHTGAPSSFTWHDPEVDLSVAFYNNGYPATGYDVGRSGRNRSSVLSTLAGDVIDD
jgi:CubicO group peptidase (beta-lactamase class C family)